MIRSAATFVAMLLMLSMCGCLHSNATAEERRTGIDLVGPQDSTSPIRVGVTKRLEVLEALGKPAQVSDDGQAIAYSFDPIIGRSGFIFLGGPCGLCGYYPFANRTHENLWLAFDADDRLKSFASSRDKNAADWRGFCDAAARTGPD